MDFWKTSFWKILFFENASFLPVGVSGGEGTLGENLHHINPSLSSLKVGIFLEGFVGPPTPPEGGGGGTKTRP